MIETTHQIHRKSKISYQSTSLDWPCEFCKSNSYKNYHIEIGDLYINICEICLKKAKQMKGSVKQTGEK